MVHHQGPAVHLRLHLAARHAAPAALRPVHALGWKVLIPVALVWLLLVATVRALNTRVRVDTAPGADLRSASSRSCLIGLTFVWDLVAAAARAADEAARRAEFDPMAGGHPVPPMPGQQLPALTAPSAPAPATRAPRPRLTDRRTTGDASCSTQLKGFGVTFATMFKKVVTEQYPEEKKPTEPRFHGRHVLNRHPDGLEKCIGCELCAWACPADAIYVEGADNTEERAVLAGRALRPRLPDQLPALHLLRPVHRGLPDPRADDEQRVRAGRRHPRQAHLREAGPARPAACPAWSRRRTRWSRAPTSQDYYRGTVTGATPARSESTPTTPTQPRRADAEPAE